MYKSIRQCGAYNFLFVVPPEITDPEVMRWFGDRDTLIKKLLLPENVQYYDMLRKHAAELDVHNTKQYATLKKQYKEYCDAFSEHVAQPLDRKIKNAMKLLEAPRPRCQEQNVIDTFEHFKRIFENDKRYAEETARKLKEESEKLRKHCAALNFLAAHNFTINYSLAKITDTTNNVTHDFSEAIPIANNIRFGELKLENESDDVDHSCCADCSSWDTSDNRCSCGNRRMCWAYDGDFENMIIYPEAY